MKTTEDLLQQLRTLEAELHHPGVLCTRARLNELLHEDFWEIGRSGRRYDRNVVIDVLASQSAPPLVEADHYAVQLLGDSYALLTFQSADMDSNGSLSRHAHRSSIWQYADGRWQLLYHQGTPAFVQD